VRNGTIPPCGGSLHKEHNRLCWQEITGATLFTLALMPTWEVRCRSGASSRKYEVCAFCLERPWVCLHVDTMVLCNPGKPIMALFSGGDISPMSTLLK
jgi:hypothetical protein